MLLWEGWALCLACICVQAKSTEEPLKNNQRGIAPLKIYFLYNPGAHPDMNNQPNASLATLTAHLAYPNMARRRLIARP